MNVVVVDVEGRKKGRQQIQRSLTTKSIALCRHSWSGVRRHFTRTKNRRLEKVFSPSVTNLSCSQLRSRLDPHWQANLRQPLVGNESILRSLRYLLFRMFTN